jgi:hypothetical protein
MKLWVLFACSIDIMRNAIAFLRESAEELRRLAAAAPDISDPLRRLADEIETTATELERRSPHTS